MVPTFDSGQAAGGATLTRKDENKMTELFYTSVENRVNLVFKDDVLKVFHNEKEIAVMSPEMVWDAVKVWISEIEVDSGDLAMQRRRLEALIAVHSSSVISGTLERVHIDGSKA